MVVQLKVNRYSHILQKIFKLAVVAAVYFALDAGHITGFCRRGTQYTPLFNHVSQ